MAMFTVQAFSANATRSTAINDELDSLCDDAWSDAQLRNITVALYGLVALKLSLMCLALCCKCCRREWRAEDEYMRNLLRPAFVPSFAGTNRDRKRKQTRALLKRLERVDSTPGTEVTIPFIHSLIVDHFFDWLFCKL